MSHALVVLLMRAGLLTDEAINALADEYERQAGWETDERVKEALEQTAHGLRLCAADTDPAPLVDPAVEFRAQYERTQIIARTKLIERRTISNDEE